MVAVWDLGARRGGGVGCVVRFHSLGILAVLVGKVCLWGKGWGKTTRTLIPRLESSNKEPMYGLVCPPHGAGATML